MIREVGALVVKVGWRLSVLHPLRRLALLLVPRGAGAEGRALVVLLDNLGDVAMNLGAIRSLPAALPGREVHLLVDEQAEAVARLAGVHVISASRQSLRATLWPSIKLLAKLKRTGYGTVLHLSTIQLGLAEYVSAITCTGAWQRIGYAGEEIFTHPAPGHLYDRFVLRFVLPRLERAYTQLVPRCAGPEGTEIAHALRHAECLLRGVAPEGAAVDVEPRAEVAPAVRAGRYALVGIGASVPYRRWPLRNFAQVVQSLQAEGLEVAAVGSAGERELVEALASLAPGVANLAGQTSLGELLSLVAGAEVVVCNETSFAHLAVALRRPLACVTGGGHIGRCSLHGYPSSVWVHVPGACDRDNWACGRKLSAGQPAPCIEAISVAEVLSGIRAARAAAAEPFTLP